MIVKELKTPIYILRAWIIQTGLVFLTHSTLDKSNFTFQNILTIQIVQYCAIFGDPASICHHDDTSWSVTRQNVISLEFLCLLLCLSCMTPVWCDQTANILIGLLFSTDKKKHNDFSAKLRHLCWGSDLMVKCWLFELFNWN